MEKFSSLLSKSALIMSTLLVPMTTYAYLTPDQVFGGSSGAHGAAGDDLQPPPTQREGEAAVAARQQQAAEQRMQAQQALVPVDAPHPAATEAAPSEPQSKGLFDQSAQYELRQQRMEDQKSQAPTIIINGGSDVRDSNGNVLHSGAPLISSTGPESVLAALAVILAAVCTVAYSNYRRKHVPVLV